MNIHVEYEAELCSVTFLYLQDLWDLYRANGHLANGHLGNLGFWLWEPDLPVWRFY